MAFGNCDGFPEFINPFLFTGGLHFSSNIFLQLMPKVFNGVAVWRLCWGFPLINPFLLKYFLYNFGSVLWVIVLHKTMTVWVGVLMKGRSPAQNLSVTLTIHYSIEYNDRCLSSAADSTPNMYFCWVFSFVCVCVCVCSTQNYRCGWYICTCSSLIFIIHCTTILCDTLII